ncbi:uncharacterized protein LOC103313454 [Tribolium castaneum]|nr:PREDICTED: peptidyl-prolyl cis-trans isomerase CYP21-2 [Tribolium castaneum]|eukprot:XP_008194977.1 PREDICTED: peptidyl-prolyl cis-trans isomerase CYP21-2 [Tribolium castaneum]
MKKKSKKVFRPCKIPRYLIGSVSPQVIKTDLAEYNAHRYKVFSAKPKTDTKPLPMNPFNYINLRKLRADAERLQMIDKENKQLLKSINTINRTIGKIDSYNPEAYASKSKWHAHVMRMKRIDRKNKAIYEKLMAATSSYDCESLRKFWTSIIEKLKLTSKFPLVILQKVSVDSVIAKQPSISCGLEKLSERPRCFLEFQVLNGPVLGRVEIELYHDHVPVTVQNFLSICCGENKQNLSYKNCPINRIVPGRFLETGDITKGTGRGGVSIYGKYFAEEGHMLKHTKPGVLSMVRVRKHDNNSRFCITFTKMEQLDMQNVVFGYIVRGAENLFKIEGYGRSIGKPLAPVIISDCGKLNRALEC